jgi:hypothetical protein
MSRYKSDFDFSLVQLTGDKYAGEFPRELFRRRGVSSARSKIAVGSSILNQGAHRRVGAGAMLRLNR